MANSSDVLVIGGGVIGLTSGLFLRRRGFSVTILDKGALGAEASWAGAGIIPPGNSEFAKTPMDQLRAVSCEMFDSFTRDLRHHTKIDTGYRMCGGIEFLESGDDYLLQKWEAEELEFAEMEIEEFEELHPHVQPVTDQPVYFPTMAQIRNPWHLRALVAACEQEGVRLKPNHAFKKFEVEGKRISGIVTEKQTLHPDHILIATGAWSRELLTPLGHPVDIQPVRGQIVLFQCEKPLIDHIYIHGKCYLVPREDGRVLAGATEEFDAGFNKQTTESGIAEMVQFAYRMVPELKKAKIEKTWAGLRPGSGDGIPYIGRVPGYENAFVAAGHFRSGIQLSPGTALLISEIIMGKDSSIPLDFFRLDRPRGSSFAPAFRS